MAWTTIKTMGAEAAVSADWNTYVRDNALAMSTWTSYTPVVKQGTTTPTFTANYCKYKFFGTTCKIVGFLTMTTTAGATGSAISVSVPTGMTISTTTQLPIGSGRLFINSFGNSFGVVAAVNATTNVAFWRTDTTFTGFAGADPSASLRVADVVSFNIEYETT